jgi:erythronate-4-phosphate dehydrogenase
VRILADRNIPGLADWFAGAEVVSTFDGRTLRAANLSDHDVLLVRSVTRVDAQLLAGSAIRFVGTATSGIDHVDVAWLQAHDIDFAAAPGCNARAVAEHVLACCVLLARARRCSIQHLRVGVIGVGHVGSEVIALLSGVGVHCLAHDPPRLRAGSLPIQTSLAEVLTADVVSLHVPLTESGPDRTRDLIGASSLAAMRAGSLLINAARGGVVDEEAWRQRLDRSIQLAADCFRDEPTPEGAFLADCLLASPHVAGHTVEARWRATGMLARALAARAGATPPPEVPFPAADLPVREVRTLEEAVLGAWDPAAATAALRACAPVTPEAFDALRRQFGQRREFSSHVLRVRDTASGDQLGRLGFKLCA